MSLQDIDIKDEYRSLIDNVVKDFYIPLLQKASEYKRAVGFFSSSALIEISKGIAGLAKNGGKILMVASPYLSDDDVEAIRKGYELRDKIIRRALVRELNEPKDLYEKDRLNLLANLVSDGILDIKIAFTEDKNKMGMYHEKMGIISDALGNKVAFSGSMNESATAMMINYETIDVFCSWKNQFENEKVNAKESTFTSIWTDCEPNIRIIDFPNLKQEIIDRYKKSTPNFNIDEQEFGERSVVLETKTKYRLGAVIPTNIKLYDYQIEAIDKWEKQDFKGIFDMATGTGKTFTGLGAVARLSEKLDDRLAVVIVCPYQHLVEQWVEDAKNFNIMPIIGYSNSPQKDWKKRLSTSVRNQKLKVRGRDFFTFICTNATFKSKIVQEQISKIKNNLLLVVDEAHNFGTEGIRNLLDDRFTYRLALSATLERHNDEEGTQKLYNYFGEKCIEYSLEQAIKEKKLTPYKYYPVVTTLTEDEREIYSKLSYEMSRNLIKGKNGKLKLSKYGEILALKRARIVAAAKEKIDVLREKIVPYKNDSYILVYCGIANVIDDNQDYSIVDECDLRQIDVVTNLLGNELNMKVSQFTSKEDIEERKILKEQFAKGEQLQALIAIKCLDEGVNIPKIKTAFILASTTNPKEYIQRRGRVLRRAEGKDFAEIYDFITLPRPLDEVSSLTIEEMKRDISLVQNEIVRMEEFGRISMNAMDSYSLIWEIRELYGLNDRDLEFIQDI
ncbi:DEAD/DEAH box helicase [Crassaminicella thermophila]|uniref:DEAD/DEAH box helicase n=1 Tax=Crassaminicella thermophila TaxID=2599308 RepID=A0A5C0SE36_CRATE|nr:DEAD/DEAH box helicase family protein [Crassaminicella thermophila]QEK11544.1 DEAD/DEAH box helicase [Crassaminicella thermophila]